MLVCAIPAAFAALGALCLIIMCIYGSLFGCSSGRMKNSSANKSARTLSGLGVPKMDRDSSGSSMFEGENPMNAGKPEREVRAPAPKKRPTKKVETWVKQFDPSSGQHYYENTVTGASQWDPPPGFEDDANDRV